MIFMCSKCGAAAVVDLASLMQIITEPHIDDKGDLKVGNVRFLFPQPKVKGKEIKFICTKSCGAIEKEELVATCGHCRKNYKASELGTNKECGHVLCSTCSSEHFPDSAFKPLDKTLETLAL